MQIPIISHLLLRIENADYPPHHEMEAVGASAENIYVRDLRASGGLTLLPHLQIDDLLRVTGVGAVRLDN